MILARRLALIVGLISLLVGAAATGVMSYEWLRPGRDLFVDESAGLFIFSRDAMIYFLPAHHSAFMAALPMAVFAGVCASQIKSRAAPIVSIVLSAVSLALIFAPSVAEVGWENYPNRTLMTLCLTALSASLVVACICLIIRRKLRVTSLIYAGTSLLPLAYAGVMSAVLQNSGPDRALYDTVYYVAAEHSVFLVLLFLMFSVISGLSAEASRKSEIILASLSAAALLIVGGYWLFAVSVLGLQGLPPSYADYPDGFAYWMFRRSVAELLLIGLLIASYILWTIRGWTVKTVADERPETF